MLNNTDDFDPEQFRKFRLNNEYSKKESRVENYSIKYVNILETDIAYVAAFIDADGSYTAQVDKNGYVHTMINVVNTNYEVLEYIQSIIGAGYIRDRKKQKPHHRQTWMYYIRGSKKTIPILNRILKYAIVKRKRCGVIIAIQNLKKAYRKGYMHTVDKQRLLVPLIKMYNQEGE